MTAVRFSGFMNNEKTHQRRALVNTGGRFESTIKLKKMKELFLGREGSI
jgi:hypothetical protein